MITVSYAHRLQAVRDFFVRGRKPPPLDIPWEMRYPFQKDVHDGGTVI